MQSPITLIGRYRRYRRERFVKVDRANRTRSMRIWDKTLVWAGLGTVVLWGMDYLVYGDWISLTVTPIGLFGIWASRQPHYVKRCGACDRRIDGLE